MRRFVAFFILCLSFLLLSGQEIFGYYESPSSNFYNFQWQKLPRNDTTFLVIKQERKYSTKYVISYNDIKVKFKIENDILLQLDSVCVHLEKIKSSHVTFFWMHVFNWSGIGYSVPPARHISKSIIIQVYPKPEYAMNGPIEAHNNALRTKHLRIKQKRVYVYNEKKRKYIKVSREKAMRTVEEEKLP